MNKVKTLAILALSSVSVAAMAADPTPLDYSASLNQFKTDLGSFLTTNGPILISCLVLALGFGIVWRLIKKATKSI